MDGSSHLPGDRYVVVGVSRTRQQWFNELARWATMAVAPIDYLKCLSGDEVMAVFGSGRRVSVVLADAGIGDLDRDLIAAVERFGAPCVVVDDGRTRRDWEGLGARSVLPADFDRSALLDVLGRHAVPVDPQRRSSARAVVSAQGRDEQRAITVSVLGGGGCGSSVVAMATAQAMATSGVDTVALLDGARRADLGLHHEIGDVIPGLPDLVEAHRRDEMDPEAVRDMCFDIEARGYSLLLGCRRHRDWTAMPVRSVHAALATVRRSFDVVVLDHDRELDGEAETGSVDLDDRHAIARAAVEQADVVLAVGGPTAQQVHDLVRLLDELLEAGVPAQRVRPVVNRATRSPAARAAITRALAQLADVTDDQLISPPLYLPRVRRLEELHHHARRLPDALCAPLGRLVHHTVAQHGLRTQRQQSGSPIRPGELGLTDAPIRFGSKSEVA